MNLTVKNKIVYMKSTPKLKKLMKQLCKDMAPALESLAKK